ncbi:CD97 antigen isoform X2 [Sphaeramia orbicularis]|uniref:CD97 antigen-like n=1 Tax=Sphaeramia orbicularis TaxID=375764 RepID=A0A673BF12_9TELE|nr:CD97 antigen-like isoform X2 [Sphaeramia orbicularis]
MGPGKGLLILGLMCVLTKSDTRCPKGQVSKRGDCVDEDECEYNPCGKHAECVNTAGSYECHCPSGFKKSETTDNVTTVNGQCEDINECLEDRGICGHTAVCANRIGSYKCTCRSGYNDNKESGQCVDVDECEEAEIAQEDICGMKGTCKNVEGSYWCKCQQGYTNYGNRKTPCSELDCDKFIVPEQTLEGLAAIWSMMRNSCLSLSSINPADEGKANGEVLLEKLFTATEVMLSPGQLDNTEDVSELLSTVEDSIRFVGPQLKDNSTRIETSQTDIDIALQRTKTRPTGPIHLTSENARLDTDWETASGNGTYPGFAMAALLSYKNLGEYVNESFEELKTHEEDAVDPTFQISSKVVSVVVSNPLTQKLSRDVNITFRHLQDMEESPERKYICAYWNERGAWSKDGCHQQRSNATHTVCQCKHLSSFAVLMALYPMEHTFGLVLATKIGLTISLLCLILCILTFKFCHSIKGTRTTIHLHLCLCLFMADLVFLAGISQTKPVGGCRFVAALLHYFFLGVFTWMLLEGVQLYRMVVLVFNATIRPLYLFIAGYGMPLVIVILSAIIRPEGYGTDQYCWLSWQNGLIWSFYGPVCFIIVVNVFFFIITVWKLAQKFTSLNPDLSKLHKIKAFTVTAIAQMCILGLMWVFGAFLFQKETNFTVAYIFTILNSLQGALVFIMHCLLSKQVREEYFHFLSCICPPQKKRYSDLSSTNPSSSQSQGSRSGQNTGESQI